MELNDDDGSADPHGYDHRTYIRQDKRFSRMAASTRTVLLTPARGRSDRPIHRPRAPGILQNPNDDRWVMVIKYEMAEKTEARICV